jgi:hypothetical protein
MQAQPGWVEPTAEQVEEVKCHLTEVVEKMRAEKAAVRAFSARVEAQRAERAA